MSRFALFARDQGLGIGAAAKDFLDLVYLGIGICVFVIAAAVLALLVAIVRWRIRGTAESVDGADQDAAHQPPDNLG